MAIFFLVLIPPAILCFLAWFTFWKYRRAKLSDGDMGVAGALMALTGVLILAYGYCWATLRIGG